MYIAFVMADLGVSYTEARDGYAEWAGTAPEQVQAGLCYDTLSAGFDGMPMQILTDLVEEVREIENGMFATAGGGSCACGTDPGEPVDYAGCTTYRASDQ